MDVSDFNYLFFHFNCVLSCLLSYALQTVLQNSGVINVAIWKNTGLYYTQADLLYWIHVRAMLVIEGIENIEVRMTEISES